VEKIWFYKKIDFIKEAMMGFLNLFVANAKINDLYVTVGPKY
jgi:hypothetical protein